MYVRLEWCDLAMLTTSSGLSLLSNLAYRLSLDSSTPVDGKDHKGDAGEIYRTLTKEIRGLVESHA